MRSPLLIACLCCLLFPATVRAEFILDDFDDPAQVVSPGMFDEFVTTTNVGPLQAIRNMRISGARGNPDGLLDSNISSASVLTGQITNLNPGASNTTRVGVQSTYDFPSTDFTEGGKNNALIFDFLQLTSEMPPSLFTVRVDDDVDFFFNFNQSLALNPGPFTIAVPFDQFQSRGGPNVLDPTKIEFMSFSLRASELSGGGPDPLNFFVELERIRVGRIPEPQSTVLLLYSLLFGVNRRFFSFIEGRL